MNKTSLKNLHVYIEVYVSKVKIDFIVKQSDIKRTSGWQKNTGETCHQSRRTKHS